MPKSKWKAVLTADVVASSALSPATLKKLLLRTAKELETRVFGGEKTFNFFQGDSWQAVLAPDAALATALLWRAAMRQDAAALDIRVAIGIGGVEYLAPDPAHSGGEAFLLSGRMLDSLKRGRTRIGIATPVADWNDSLQVACVLAEGNIGQWTSAAAQAVYLAWLHGETQDQLAKRLGLAQPSVHKRLTTAHWPAIRFWEESFRAQLARYSTAS